jgi:hypothetical protein
MVLRDPWQEPMQRFSRSKDGLQRKKPMARCCAMVVAASVAQNRLESLELLWPTAATAQHFKTYQLSKLS